MPVELIEKGNLKQDRFPCPACGNEMSVTYNTETTKIVSSTERWNEFDLSCFVCGSKLRWTPPVNLG